MSQTSVKQKEKTVIKARVPDKYKVVIYNDDSTPMDFVVGILMVIFNHDESSAFEIMMKIHTENSAIAGVYTYEVAEQKAIDATMSARSNDHPLLIKMEIA